MFGRSAVMIALLCSGIVAACGEPPSEPNSSTIAAVGDNPRAVESPVTLSGPDTVSTSGSYTYLAQRSVVGANFKFYVRTCPTGSIPACSAPFTFTSSTMINAGAAKIVKSLQPDCSGGGTKSYQVKVVVTGSYVVPDSAFKVTNLCGQVEV